jgi:hypothetical protein
MSKENLQAICYQLIDQLPIEALEELVLTLQEIRDFYQPAPVTLKSFPTEELLIGGERKFSSIPVSDSGWPEED